MTKDDFIKKYGELNDEFIADLNSFASSYLRDDNYDDEDEFDFEQDEEDRKDEEYLRIFGNTN